LVKKIAGISLMGFENYDVEYKLIIVACLFFETV